MTAAAEKQSSTSTMNALVYHGPGKKSWEPKPRPQLIKPTDAIVRITTSTICGTDLHILRGDLPSVADGRILGHEGVGVVEEVGPGIANFRTGDRVIISCITSCGKCSYCKRAMPSHCSDGGWILGNSIDGTQAEYVRIPHAENSLHRCPDGIAEEALVMFSDILPTGFECGVLNGQVKPGDKVAIVGSGPVGLAALLTARFFSPAEIIMIDKDDNRLQVAKALGATKLVNGGDGKAAEKVMALTDGIGVDVAIEAVGSQATFDICQSVIAPGGHIANIGVHGCAVQLHLEKLWDRNITLATRLVDTVTTPMLLKVLVSGTLNVKQLVTHRFELSDVLQAYETFGNAAKLQALKVILKGVK